MRPKITGDLESDVRDYVEESNYASATAFVRDAVRRRLEAVNDE